MPQPVIRLDATFVRIVRAGCAAKAICNTVSPRLPERLGLARLAGCALLGPDFARVLPVVDQLLQVTRGLLRLVERRRITDRDADRRAVQLGLEDVGLRAVARNPKPGVFASHRNAWSMGFPVLVN